MEVAETLARHMRRRSVVSISRFVAKITTVGSGKESTRIFCQPSTYEIPLLYVTLNRKGSKIIVIDAYSHKTKR